MRHSPFHAETDEAVVRALIAENPWATLVSHPPGGELVASHYPVLLDDESENLAIVTHVGRPDEKLHRFGEAEMLLIIAGPHGYISPSWYVEGDTPVPTWNFSVAHCYGVAQILDAEENLRVLTRLVDHFERHVENPVPLDQEFGAQLSKGTVGLRLPITRFVCKVKMSKDKDPVSQRRVLDALRSDGPYRNDALAEQMERALEGRPAGD
ncbi:MAG: transcriptional regulator [Solirubrobacterales bacterium]|nr:transcriptional regulator [Solirubrobacterales bacterium]